MKYPYFFRTDSGSSYVIAYLMMRPMVMYRIDNDYFERSVSSRTIENRAIYMPPKMMLHLILPNLEVKRKIIMTLLGD